MTYVPDWEPMADALQRVVAIGLVEDEAKRQLCRAIADRKLELRIILTEDPSRGVPEQAVSGSEFHIPPRLSPGDIDWIKSRPLTDWPPVGYRPGQPMMTMLHIDRIRHLVERKIAQIRLPTTDIMAIFGAASKPISADLISADLTPGRSKSKAPASGEHSTA